MQRWWRLHENILEKGRSTAQEERNELKHKCEKQSRKHQGQRRKRWRRCSRRRCRDSRAAVLVIYVLFSCFLSVPSGAVSFSPCCSPQRTVGNDVNWPLCLCTRELVARLQLFFPRPPARPSIHPSVHPSIHPSIHASLPHCLSFLAHPLSVFPR